MLEFAVRATKVFTHPTCSITANVAFTLEEVGDDRLLGPWVQRGEVNGHPRYSLVGDRSTNLEWSDANGLNRWVMFTDGVSGVVFCGRQLPLGLLVMFCSCPQLSKGCPHTKRLKGRRL